MHFGNPPAEHPKAADGDAMLYNSPTAELKNEITHSYSGSVNFGPLFFHCRGSIALRRASEFPSPRVAAFLAELFSLCRAVWRDAETGCTHCHR
jgi:hypothetical protein